MRRCSQSGLHRAGHHRWGHFKGAQREYEAGAVSVAAVPNNAQPVNIPFSLKGFSDGFGELQRAKSRRTGMLSFLNRS